MNQAREERRHPEGDGQLQHQKPVVIEDEPPYEFYASLLGKKAPSIPIPCIPSGSVSKESSSSSLSLSSTTCSASFSSSSVFSRVLPPRRRDGPSACCSLPSCQCHDCNSTVPVIPAEDVDSHGNRGILTGKGTGIGNTNGELSEYGKVYQRALSDPPQLSSFTLDRSNRGYRLLQRMGYREEEGGLGRNRQGSLLPIATRWKTDKKGLGAQKTTKKGRNTRDETRITHRPHDERKEDSKKKGTDDLHLEQGRKTETKAERRRRKRREEERDKLRDKRARMLLRTDISEEYEDLYLKLHR